MLNHAETEFEEGCSDSILSQTVEENEHRPNQPERSEEQIDNTMTIMDDSEHLGDRSDRKKSKTLRLGFININGLPIQAANNKNNQLRESINLTQFDIIGLAETNINWSATEVDNKWETRIQSWWEHHRTITSYNCKDVISRPFQPGGTAMISVGRISYRVTARGVDQSKLGRWCWFELRGRHGLTTKIITVYRPCRSNGPHSTYQQQERVMQMATSQTNIDVREQLLEDLLSLIDQWRTQGNQVVLLTDMNTDIEADIFIDRLHRHGLRNIMKEAHPDLEKVPTHHLGSNTIDGIFATSTIQAVQAGYCAFGTFPSDHRAIWIDLTFFNLFGYDLEPIQHPQARRLKCDDPPTQARWRSMYTEKLQEGNCFERIYRLQEDAQVPLTQAQTLEYEAISTIRESAANYADRHCRKLTMGAVPYSPQFRQAQLLIELWDGVVKIKTGCKFSSTKLRRLETKVHVMNSRAVTLEAAMENKREAYRKYWATKKRASFHRKSFIMRKASNLADLNANADEKNIYAELMRREDQRLAARRIRTTLKKMKGSGVTSISVPTEDDTWREATKKNRY
jgi:hypothetical protein